MPVPSQIDGADVVAWVTLDPQLHHDTGACRMFANGVQQTFFDGLAIATYDLDSYYLFFCDGDWKTENDSFHESVAEAMQDAQRMYCVAPSQWTFLIEELRPVGRTSQG